MSLREGVEGGDARVLKTSTLNYGFGINIEIN